MSTYSTCRLNDFSHKLRGDPGEPALSAFKEEELGGFIPIRLRLRTTLRKDYPFLRSMAWQSSNRSGWAGSSKRLSSACVMALSFQVILAAVRGAPGCVLICRTFLHRGFREDSPASSWRETSVVRDNKVIFQRTLSRRRAEIGGRVTVKATAPNQPLPDCTDSGSASWQAFL